MPLVSLTFSCCGLCRYVVPFLVALVAISIASRPYPDTKDEEARQLRLLYRQASTILEEAGIDHWLDRSSLLQAARDQRPLPYDGTLDVDVAIVKHDFMKAMRVLTQQTRFPSLIVKEGSIGGRHIKATSRSTWTTLDICPMELKNNRIMDPFRGSHEVSGKSAWGSFSRRLVNVEFEVVFPLRNCTWMDLPCKCPRRVNEYLKSGYGDDWYIPLPDDRMQRSKCDNGCMASYIDSILANSPYLTKAMKSDLQQRRAGIANA
eukprot:TRINITY_DN22542_c0_g1_i1.p1 TRINITY_DN22542_c0_g1~~TRINITY_DN22542_c0_g1_i1.p1  ORF type:complete len:262 (+),score=10.20 TRINITY_DN22542_c0_g1_i1:96-881(+)